MAISRFILSVLVFELIFRVETTILLYHLQITQINQTFTRAFDAPFQNFPIFTFFIQSGTIQSTEFSVNYDETITTLTSTQIVINFYTYKPTAFSTSEFINIGLLITDEWNSQFEIGIKKVNISSTFSLTFPGLTLVKNGSASGMLQIYSMSLPMIYSQALNLASTNSLTLTVSKSSMNYNSKINFAYIFYSRTYVGSKVMAIFQRFNQSIYNALIPFMPFAFEPSTDNIVFAYRQYDSTTIPFLNSQVVANYNFITGANPSMMIGYSFPSGTPLTFRSDIFFFNNSYSGCPESQFLFFVILYQTLPYSCIPCDATCKSCTTSSQTNPTLTDAFSCTTCTWLRYLNASTLGTGTGNCICLPGIDELSGACQDCEQSCLKFTASYIETTNTSNFLLQYSFPTVVQLVPLESNLQIYINGIQVAYDPNQQQDSYYIIKLSLIDMKVCEDNVCQIYFTYQHPEYVLIPTMTKCLANNNQTVTIQNYIDYYSYFPNSLQQAFNILGIAIGMAFSGGYSSLVTILFQVEQLIDAHRYVKLTLPVVFNQLLLNMIYFRFMSILNLLPQSYSQDIQNCVPNDLDCLGPPKLLYYENGLNYYKNTITAFISVGALLVMNFIIYLILKLIPLKITRKLAKKIAIRKFITFHDTVQQLELPCMYFALQQLQVTLLHPNLIWIYTFSLLTTISILIFPFLIILYIYNDRQNKSKIEIYEDLLQDNSMNQKVTYIYYIFNYYRKVIFAMCILSIIPGLVQIYMLLILNSLHLAFQVYLVVSRTYKSKMKIVIRFTNDFCIIAIQIMILLYNLNDYPKDVMINIGMACMYLTLVSTIMGIIDVFVKIGDTCLQQLRSKHQEESKKAIQKLKILKQFKNQIKCNIGQELQERPKDPKQIKFLEDKELMENTFNKDNQSQNISIHLSDKGQQNADRMDLVYIDDDWEQTYPYQIINFKPKLNKQTGKLVKQALNADAQVDLYQIPKQIDKEAKKINENRVKRRKNKYQIEPNEKIIVQNQKVQHRIKTKQTQEKGKHDYLVVTILTPDKLDAAHSESSAIQETNSQQ